MIEKLCELIEDDESHAICLNESGNDVWTHNKLDLFTVYKEVLQKIRVKEGKVTACSILPWREIGREWISLTVGFRCHLEQHVKNSALGFIDIWDHFYGSNLLDA